MTEHVRQPGPRSDSATRDTPAPEAQGRRACRRPRRSRGGGGAAALLNPRWGYLCGPIGWSLAGLGVLTSAALWRLWPAGLPIASARALAALCGLSVLLLGILHEYGRRRISALATAHAKAQQLADLNSSVIASFAMAIDAKDQHTHGHTERVRDVALTIGDELGLGEDDLEALKTAAMLHDIGKLAVPDYILSKPERLTEEEMKKVETHTLVGAAILESVRFPWPVVPIIRGHHEWYDGTGYPDRLAGDDIPLGARILAVADVYDSLLSHRPYRAAMTVEEALSVMRERAGTQFDPQVLEACLRRVVLEESHRRRGFIFDSSHPGAAESVGRQAVFRDIKQAHQELLGLYEIVQTMGRSLNVQETLDLIISKTRRIIEFSTCALFLHQPEHGHLVVAAAAGPHAETIQGQRLPLGKGLSGRVALSGPASEPDQPASEDLAILMGPSAAECKLVHALCIPLAAETETIGVITLYRSEGRPFTRDDARLAFALGRQAAIAISNARQYEETRQYAMTDELTGLANARSFFLRLEEELSRARRERTRVSLIAVDLDNLKGINDNFGHQQGDRVLRILAEIFRRHVRDYDTVVRYAGDEFFIILPNTPNQQALETANRIKRAVRETSVEMLPGRFVGLGASFGVATFPGDAQDADALIAAADHAMYADKRLTRQLELLRGGARQGQSEAAPTRSSGGAARP